MRLYAILVYIVILNLVFGAVASMMPFFLPEANGVLNLPSTTDFNEQLSSISNQSELLGSGRLTGTEWFGTMISLAFSVVSAGFWFLFSMFTSTPEFIAQIFASIGIEIPSVLITILKIGLIVLTIYTAIQILTGKWFSFVE